MIEGGEEHGEEVDDGLCVVLASNGEVDARNEQQIAQSQEKRRRQNRHTRRNLRVL